MAQFIKNRRGTAAQLKTTTLAKAELGVSTGSVAGVTTPILHVGDGSNAAGFVVGRLHQGGTVPTLTAGNIGSAAQHSQCLWATLAHLPGLKVIAPSSLHDHKGLMASAIRSNDPVVVFEHKELLLKRAKSFQSNSYVPSNRYTVPIGKAIKLLEGNDITLVTLSFTVELALEASIEIAKEWISVEVIDLRSIVPLDIKTILESVLKTKRLLVVDEDYLSFGLTGEIITRVIENLGVSELKQIRRLAVPDVPIPAASSIEEEIMPNKNSIKNLLKLMSKGE